MEPSISVGILSGKQLEFEFYKPYRCNGRMEIQGFHQVGIDSGQIAWNGGRYTELLFEPAEPTDSFSLKDVVIGVNFHWERKEDQQFRGALKIIVEGNILTAVNLIGVEDYLTSVISSEMSATASLNLLKSHAVISRSWLLSQIDKNKEITDKKIHYSASTQTDDELIRWYDREDHINFDVCADDHCQRYQGITRTFANLETVKQAIKETRGQVLMYDGKICDARFSKCCGGVTEEFQNCWEDVKYPYLVKLRDTADLVDIPDLTLNNRAIEWIQTSPPSFCNTQNKGILRQVLNNYDQETHDFYRWKVSYQYDELSDLVKGRTGMDLGTISDLIPIERGTSGRLTKLKIVGSKKSMIIGKELEIRRSLSKSHLYSSAFYVEKKDGRFILYGAGWGHGVGLCQIGAAVMAEEGYAHDRILLHYFKGSKIETLYK